MLKRDGAENCSLALRRDALFDFDGGVETSRPAPVECDTPLELVHHLNRAVLDHVIYIAAQQSVGVQRVLYGSQEHDIALVVQIAASERLLHGRNPVICQSSVMSAD